MSHERKSSPDQELQARLTRIEELIVRFAGTGTLDNTLGHGVDAMSGHLSTLNARLASLTAELTPLRRLSGPSVPFSDEQRAHLAGLLAAHARADFRNISSLTSTDGGLRFIGDPLPVRDPSPTPGVKRSIKS